MDSSDLERTSFAKRIYDINEKDFEQVALDVWKYQYKYNQIYHQYCDLLGTNPTMIQEIGQIPFLPIQMFRDHPVKTGYWREEKVFRSSGTSGSVQSQHHIRYLDWYHHFAKKTFTTRFGEPGTYTWLGLLPSYLDRPDSSLVDMVHSFMKCHENPENKFYPVVNRDIIDTLHLLQRDHQPVVLFGVSFALVDLFEMYEVPVWNNLLVIETGGMKGTRPEITREELHTRIRQRHPEVKIESEYGMTELCSQAYTLDLHFHPGQTMKVFTRDISDPLNLIEHGRRGALNIVDLCNLDTCSFIATDDVGISYPDGSFDVLGRLDQSDVRGCNLLYS